MAGVSPATELCKCVVGHAEACVGHQCHAVPCRAAQWGGHVHNTKWCGAQEPAPSCVVQRSRHAAGLNASCRGSRAEWHHTCVLSSSRMPPAWASWLLDSFTAPICLSATRTGRGAVGGSSHPVQLEGGGGGGGAHAARLETAWRPERVAGLSGYAVLLAPALPYLESNSMTASCCI